MTTGTKTKATATALATVGNREFAILRSSPDALPALIKENVGEEGISAFDLDRVKIPAGGGAAWEIPTLDGEEVLKSFEGVIIFHKAGRVFWTDEFTGQGNPPDCASDDGITGVGEPGGECADCPFARFGSDTRGGRAQACKQVKQLFVLLPEGLLPVCLSLPPTSLAVARKFLLRLASNGLPYYAVCVTFGLEKTQNSQGIEYSRVTLAVAERLSAEQAGHFRRMSEGMRPHLAKVRVGAEDYSADGDEDDQS